MTTRRVLQRAWPVLVGACIGPGASTAQLPDPPEAISLDVHGAWRIEQARSEPLLDRSRARLDFGPDDRLGGHTSCNTLSARYTLDGTVLKIGPVVTTRMACSAQQLEQEDRVLTALELVASARVRSDGLLELRDAEGRGLLRATRLP